MKASLSFHLVAEIPFLDARRDSATQQLLRHRPPDCDRMVGHGGQAPVVRGATIWTLNRSDFADLPDLVSLRE